MKSSSVWVFAKEEETIFPLHVRSKEWRRIARTMIINIIVFSNCNLFEVFESNRENARDSCNATDAYRVARDNELAYRWPFVGVHRFVPVDKNAESKCWEGWTMKFTGNVYDFRKKIGRFRRKSTSERNVETLMKWKLVLLWKYRVNISRIENRRVIFRSLKKIYIHIYVPDEKWIPKR